jgi:hypothetical protein
VREYRRFRDRRGCASTANDTGCRLACARRARRAPAPPVNDDILRAKPADGIAHAWPISNAGAKPRRVAPDDHEIPTVACPGGAGLPRRRASPSARHEARPARHGAVLGGHDRPCRAMCLEGAPDRAHCGRSTRDRVDRDGARIAWPEFCRAGRASRRSAPQRRGISRHPPRAGCSVKPRRKVVDGPPWRNISVTYQCPGARAGEPCRRRSSRSRAG